jgi:hypothetical protein
VEKFSFDLLIISDSLKNDLKEGDFRALCASGFIDTISLISFLDLLTTSAFFLFIIDLETF